MRFGVGGCVCRHGVYKSRLQLNLPSAVGCDYIAFLHLEEKADGLSQGAEQVFVACLLGTMYESHFGTGSSYVFTYS